MAAGRSERGPARPALAPVDSTGARTHLTAVSQHPRDLWRVQFVSKAIVPPFRDGTKCLVRDLCLHLSGFAPHVLGAGTAPDELEGRAHVHAVYGGSAGQYTPTLLSNLRAFAWLLASEPPDLFHFVFAPNPRTSLALRLLGEWTRVPCVQTVASAPRTFERPDRLFSGDVVVAQSHDTARRIHEAFALAKLPPRPVEIIPPPAPELPGDPRARTVAARAALGLAPNVPLVVYPGDLEVSRGAAFTVELARRAEGPLAAATFVVAYRRKTAEVDRLAHELEAGAPPGRVVFRPEVDDVHALLAAATAV